MKKTLKLLILSAFITLICIVPQVVYSMEFDDDSSYRKEPPHWLLCSISSELMEDPVIDSDGNTFERSQIEAWLKKQSTSPITRKPMKLDELRPNRHLQEAVEGWAKENSTHPEAKEFISRRQLISNHNLKGASQDGGGLGLISKWSVRFIEYPTQDSLNLIQVEELGIFWKEGKLYCKVHDKEKLEIIRGDETNNPGLTPEIFDRLVKTAQNSANPEILSVTLQQEDECQQNLANFNYNRAYEHVTEPDVKALLQLVSQCGYTLISQTFNKGLSLRDSNDRDSDASSLLNVQVQLNVLPAASQGQVQPVGMNHEEDILDIAEWGHVDKYTQDRERFQGGILFYTDPNSGDKKEIRISDLENPCKGMLDLFECGDASKYLSVSTGYKINKNKDNHNKIEIHFLPWFLLEEENDCNPNPFKGIFPDDCSKTSPIAVIWSWGGWAKPEAYCYYLLESQEPTYLSSSFNYLTSMLWETSEDLYSIEKKSTMSRENRSVSDFMTLTHKDGLNLTYGDVCSCFQVHFPNLKS